MGQMRPNHKGLFRSIFGPLYGLIPAHNTNFGKREKKKPTFLPVLGFLSRSQHGAAWALLRAMLRSMMARSGRAIRGAAAWSSSSSSAAAAAEAVGGAYGSNANERRSGGENPTARSFAREVNQLNIVGRACFERHIFMLKNQFGPIFGPIG